MSINAPPKQELITMFKFAVNSAKLLKSEELKVITKMENLIELMEEGKTLDNSFLIVLLSRLPGKDATIFQKDYVYFRPKKENLLSTYVFEDDKAFFEGLPSLSA